MLERTVGGGGRTESNFAILLTTVENSFETKDGLKRTSKEYDLFDV